MKFDEKWIRAHLPKEVANQPIDFFSHEYLDGLTVMHEGERGKEDVVVYRAKDEEDLHWWWLERVCHFVHEPNAPEKKIWRYYRDHTKENKWLYIEHKNYDYNAIEDNRLYGFESFLRIAHYAFPFDIWEKRVQEHIKLMNYWYKEPHWDYDCEKLCFIEISDSKEQDGDGILEPREGSIIKVED